MAKASSNDVKRYMVSFPLGRSHALLKAEAWLQGRGASRLMLDAALRHVEERESSIMEGGWNLVESL